MLTANDIREMAKNQGLYLAPGGISRPGENPEFRDACARRVLVNEVMPHRSMHSESAVNAVREKFGLTLNDQQMLEAGFEGFDDFDDFDDDALEVSNYYYGVGVELRKSL